MATNPDILQQYSLTEDKFKLITKFLDSLQLLYY